MQVITCCFLCRRRKPGCHGSCGEYLAARQARDAQLRENAREQEIEATVRTERRRLKKNERDRERRRRKKEENA